MQKFLDFFVEIVELAVPALDLIIDLIRRNSDKVQLN